jgi:hypothetical protein
MRQMRMPPWRIEGVIELSEMYKRGEAKEVTDAVRVVARKEPVTFAQFTRGVRKCVFRRYGRNGTLSSEGFCRIRARPPLAFRVNHFCRCTIQLCETALAREDDNSGICRKPITFRNCCSATSKPEPTQRSI